jgi:hypothetical protein
LFSLTPQVLTELHSHALPVSHAPATRKIIEPVMPKGRPSLDYAHSRFAARVNLSYPWGGAGNGLYPEMGIGKNIIEILVVSRHAMQN